MEPISSSPQLTPSPTSISAEDKSEARTIIWCPNPNAQLEMLPPELRIQILFLLGIVELKALVRASSVFHNQYLLGRRPLLCTCLERTLAGVTRHALAGYEYKYRYPYNKITHRDRILRSLEHSEGGGRFSRDLSFLIGKYNVDQVAEILGWLLKGRRAMGPLTETETMRLMRGLYLFQLFCIIFGVNEFKIGGPMGLSDRGISWLRTLENPIHALLERFTRIYMPWEIEGIACINAFAKDKFDQIFNQADINDEFRRATLVSRAITHGLELLHSAYFKKGSHKQLIDDVHNNYLAEGTCFEVHRDASIFRSWPHRGWNHSGNRDLSTEKHEWLLSGENSRDQDQEWHPPPAWEILPLGNMGALEESDEFCRWGYVFWDAKRLDHTGARGVLERFYVEKSAAPSHNDVGSFVDSGNVEAMS
ncbi:hypothetical protein N7474_001034 [Penicillium riverlandense]|uniref:uncharacterized protein n=1 Tax=Penicillium riverlandense TaxID=1903569 RepID=UPI002549AF56|nr:uncharacterized protein N7474_001034 [Penicillium riverlandense]KAJ5832723.1 hypothetical protein N7474_001034 [Penicillium riverlandense]